jgi:hypothetical protein
MSLRDLSRQLLRKIKHRIVPPDTGYMSWVPILERERSVWADAVSRANGPYVLLGTSLGRFKWEVNFDSTLAVALTLRGARVRVVMCDRQLEACSAWVRQGMGDSFHGERDTPQATLCDGCYQPGVDVMGPLSLPIWRYSGLVDKSALAKAVTGVDTMSLEQIRRFELDAMSIGEHAVAGAIRFFACARLEDVPDHLTVTRRYLRAAIMTTIATQRLFDEHPFAVACGSHGIYVPQGLVFEVARKRGARVVNWHQAYRRQCVLFSHGDTYHKTLLHEPVHEWMPSRWTGAHDAAITQYLDSRQYGKQDWIAFNREPDARSIEAATQLGVDFSRPIIGLLTNVAWDAQLHYGATPFDDMMSWLVETIRYFATRPELQLLIRIHPAEVKGYIVSRQPALAEIQRAFPTLPTNIFVIPPESTISTYETMGRCNAVIIYATKTGIELTARGTPVIVAGEAWIKNKGFAFDAHSREEYLNLLGQLPLDRSLDEEKTRLAKQYAYHFFLRRMIPVKFLDDKLRASVKSLAELAPGADPGLDVICRGILEASSFIYDQEVP